VSPSHPFPPFFSQKVGLITDNRTIFFSVFPSPRDRTPPWGTPFSFSCREAPPSVGFFGATPFFRRGFPTPPQFCTARYYGLNLGCLPLGVTTQPPHVRIFMNSTLWSKPLGMVVTTRGVKGIPPSALSGPDGHATIFLRTSVFTVGFPSWTMAGAPPVPVRPLRFGPQPFPLLFFKKAFFFPPNTIRSALRASSRPTGETLLSQEA